MLMFQEVIKVIKGLGNVPEAIIMTILHDSENKQTENYIIIQLTVRY